MDIHGPTRFGPRKSPPPNRLLSAYPHASQPSGSTAASFDELNEDDIFTTDISEPADPHRHHHDNHLYNNSNNKIANFSENFGILAALPESPTHCCHKASVSTSRAIPGIPKPPQQQQRERSPFGKLKYQSAPVNVPVLAKAMRNRRYFDDVDEDDEGDNEMVLPPHEIVARANTPVVSCSVLEGVGRTLKGRDLRQSDALQKMLQLEGQINGDNIPISMAYKLPWVCLLALVTSEVSASI
ncbi:senescence regulator s40-related [Citrus sinensis]|nr:senescence regulator s40-related [Citrus sinensis]